VSRFAKIATAVGDADRNLGNVMGLNPFHDYEAWTRLKRIQELNISSMFPENFDIKSEIEKIENDLRAQLSTPQTMTTALVEEGSGDSQETTGSNSGWIQLINATHLLNISAGVWKPSVLRGLSFNCLAIALS